MKKVLKNIFASALPQIVNIVSNLILPALIIARFGSDINGLVSTTKTIVSYVSIVGAGIAAAVTQSLYKPVAENKSEEVKGMLHAANNMFLKFGLIYLALTIAVAFIYPLLIKTDIKYLTIVLLLFVMSISGASEFFITGRCRSLLYAKQQVYVSNIIQASSLALSLVFAVLMLRFSDDIILVELAISFVYILRAGFLLAYVNLKYPEYRSFSKVPPIKKSVEKRYDAMVHQITGLVVTGSQSLILSVICGLTSASIYSVYFIVFNGLQSICANLATAVTPFLGKELALDNKEKALRIYDMIEFGFSCLATFVYAVSVIMIIPFVALYTREADTNYIYKSFSVLFVFSSMFFVLKMPSTNAVNAAGHFKETKWRAVIEAALCVIISVVCCFAIGKDGVLIGSLVALGWRCFDTVFYVNKRIINNTLKRSTIRLAESFVVVGLFCVASFFIPINPKGYLEWVLFALVASLAAIALVLIISFVFEKKTLSNIFRVFFRKKDGTESIS